jgi:3-carboxy-cis,cis-muconate cycloisomerase
MAQGLVGLLFGCPAMQSVFDAPGTLQGMLDFESALARAESRLGLIPESAAHGISQSCKAEWFDIPALARDAVQAGNTAIPMVRQLTRLVAAQDATASGYVHWGATSQDAQDTGVVLQIRAALDLVDARMDRLCEAAADLMQRHRTTLLAGRTWMQQALPITFALKAAGWLDALVRHRERLAEARRRVLVLQFGGAAGTLASLGERGWDVAAAISADLELPLPTLPWHSHRDRIAETGTTLALLIGTLGKIARDISLLMQTEVGEALEPGAPGRGGSSSMPHKRNPVACAAVLAAAVRAPGLVATLLTAMVQEHERGLGGWHAEWTALPELFDLAAGALDHLCPTVAELEVNAERMQANVDLTQGLILAEAIKMGLAPKLGGPTAFGLVEQACAVAVKENRPLREVIGANAQVAGLLSSQEINRLFDPARYLGMSQVFVDRALSGYKANQKLRQR